MIYPSLPPSIIPSITEIAKVSLSSCLSFNFFAGFEYVIYRYPRIKERAYINPYQCALKGPISNIIGLKYHSDIIFCYEL